MFFLGLLSTPLPYLLLAAFYFFGFAMGMFNNNTGDENTEATLSSVTIPAEIKQKNNTEHSVYYFQVTNPEKKIQNNTLKLSDLSVGFSPDTGPKVFFDRNAVFYEFQFSNFQFSRPPPSGC